jgi:hypothetical protein
MAGLDPAILVFVEIDERDVDARLKPAHDGMERVGWAEAQSACPPSHVPSFAAVGTARSNGARRSASQSRV